MCGGNSLTSMIEYGVCIISSRTGSATYLTSSPLSYRVSEKIVAFADTVVVERIPNETALSIALYFVLILHAILVAILYTNPFDSLCKLSQIE